MQNDFASPHFEGATAEGGPIIRSYRDLRVWREAMELAAHAYRLTSSFPSHELYGLTSQVRRAAASVPANIAEGYGRESKGAYVQLLRVAQGSLKELETHLLLAEKIAITNTAGIEPLLTRSDTVGRMLHGLIRSLDGSG
jgi:four helix bundle protein